MGAEWKVFDLVEGGLPAAALDDGDRTRVAAWLERLRLGPVHAGGTLMPVIHMGNTLSPDDEDYQPPIENLFERRIPGTDWVCRYQVHYDQRVIYLTGFNRGVSP
jgi:hypothetical protein